MTILSVIAAVLDHIVHVGQLVLLSLVAYAVLAIGVFVLLQRAQRRRRDAEWAQCHRDAERARPGRAGADGEPR
jgi:hypothetical protein